MRKLIITFIILSILCLIGCEMLTQPESEGNAAIILEYADEPDLSSQPGKPGNGRISESIDAVSCTVTRNNATEWAGDLILNGDYFTAEITLKSGSGYRFDVECSTNGGLAYTGYRSNVAIKAGETVEVYLTLYLTIPETPSDLNASGISSDLIYVSWNDNAVNEDGYRIERKQSLSGTFIQIAVVGEDAAFYNDNDVISGNQYYYRTSAYNVSGSSAYSNIDSARAELTTPFAPTGLAGESITGTEVNIIWEDNALNEDGYRIERKNQGAASFSEIAVLNENDTTYLDIGLTEGDTYQYRVRAYNSAGNSGYSNQITVTAQLTAPNDPSNLMVEAVSATQIELTWEDNSLNETGFKIERKGGSGSSFTQVASVGADLTNYTDISLNPVTIYEYRVYAYNDAGISNYSNTASDTTEALGAPAAPSDLQAVAVSTTQIDLSWTDNSGDEEGFVIERSLNQSGPYSIVETVEADITVHNDTGLVSSTHYYYRVYAYNSIDDSDFSNIASATTMALPVPDPPTSLAASAISMTQIDLSWNDNSNDETGFVIQRSFNQSGSYATLDSVAADMTVYHDTGLSANTIYYYRVFAYNTYGNSDYSNNASASTPSMTIPNAPSNLRAVGVSSSQINLKWEDNSDNEDGFDIFNDNSSTPYNLHGSVAPNVTHYQLLPSPWNTNFCVKAFNSAGSSENSNVANAELISTYDIITFDDTPGYAHDIYIYNDRAYIADQDFGLTIIDISDVGFPETLGTIDTPSQAMGVTVAGNYAYVADYFGGLRVIDISDPANPAEVTNLNTPGLAEDVAAGWNHIYLADGEEGLQIFDISNPASPVEAGNLDIPGYAQGIVTEGNYVYIAAGGEGLIIVNVSNPASPVIVGSLNTTGYAYDLDIAGNYTYIADGLSGVWKVDISDKANPVPAAGGIYNTDGEAVGIDVSGNIAYVADFNNNFLVIDVNSTPIFEIASTDTPGESNAIRVTGNYAYIADGYEGMQIIYIGD